MKFNEIRPFIRYARVLTINNISVCYKRIAYDARMFCLKSGNGIISADGKKYYMKKGSLIILNSMVEYWFEFTGEKCEYYAFNYDYTQISCKKNVPIAPDNPDEFNADNITENVRFDDNFELNRCLYLTDMFEIESKVKNIINEYNYKYANYEMKISSLFTEILVDCIRKFQNCNELKNTVCKLVFSYVSSNYDKNITNEDIGKELGFHPNYINKIIKSNTGMPLHQYILHLKILRAVELLESGCFTVKDVSEKCGFCDIYYFSKYFKSVMNISPSKYRQKNIVNVKSKCTKSAD